MGMFDEIRVEHILPGETEITDTWYQTKSLENVMAKYVITAKGELYEDRWDYEWIDDPDHFLKGYLNKIENSYRREYLTDFHGDIIFYRGKPMEGTNRVWRDYHARFTDGKLSRMWYVDRQY
jgi:hypothetical protein